MDARIPLVERCADRLAISAYLDPKNFPRRLANERFWGRTVAPGGLVARPQKEQVSSLKLIPLPQCTQNLGGMETALLRLVRIPSKTSRAPAVPLMPQYHIHGSEIAVEPR